MYPRVCMYVCLLGMLWQDDPWEFVQGVSYTREMTKNITRIKEISIVR